MDIRKILEFAKKEFVYGGHLPALGAVSVVLTSVQLLGAEMAWDLLIIVYLIFYIIYAYDRLRGIEDDYATNRGRTEHTKKVLRYFPAALTVSVGIVLLLLLSSRNLGATILGLLMIVSGFLYTEYFKQITKRLIGFKTLYVSFVWACLPLLTAVYCNLPVNSALLIVFCFMFYRAIVNTVFFDIKDIASDKKRGLKTIPAFFGRRGSLFFIHIVNFVSFLPLIFGVYRAILPPFALALLFFYFYSFYYLRIAEKGNANIQKLSYVMVDGESLFWPLVLLLAREWIII